MHAPDGFLTAGTAIATGVVSAGGIGVALRSVRRTMRDKQVPLAGICAAFVFAVQMFNFPVAAGTTGHLLGGTLAAVLLGPALGAVVVAVVVAVQALAFADGGLTALGYNTLNMAVVTAFGGYAVFLLLRRVLPRTGAGVVLASGLAAGVSVVLASMAFSLEWLFGASAPVPFDTVFGAMVGVHALIGVGEGLLTAMAVGAVLAARADLVHGARDLDRAQLAVRRGGRTRGFLIGGFLVALVMATVVSQFAGSDPDGLQRVAEDEGFADSEQAHALDSGPFAGYATQGLDNEGLSLAVAGGAGVALTLAVGAGLLTTVRAGRRHEQGAGVRVGDTPSERVSGPEQPSRQDA